MDLIANKRLRYRGRAMARGGEFTADRAHGKVLVATGLAREVELGAVQTPRAPREVKRPNPLDRDHDGRSGRSLPASPPSLRGKSKARLLEIADAEKVAIPDREASNSVLIAAIQAKRNAA